MEPTLFNLNNLKDILAPLESENIQLAHYFRFDEDGLFPSEEIICFLSPSEANSLRWKPVWEVLNENDEIDVEATPALPPKFTAKELAAFMVDGVGSRVAAYYGDWCDGPDAARLNNIGSCDSHEENLPEENINKNKCRPNAAIRNAYAAYREAELVVGKFDKASQYRAQELAEKFDDTADSDPAKAHLKVEMTEANKLAELDFAKWRMAMVRQLLQPAKSTLDGQAAPVPVMVPVAELGAALGTLDATVVVPASESRPAALTTTDIANGFAGLKWETEKKWKKPLADKPKWLADCIATAGVRGMSETRWNPVLIGAALVVNGHAKANQVRAKFQTVHQFKPWLDEWKTYEANNLDTL